MNKIDEIAKRVSAEIEARPKILRKLWDTRDETWAEIRKWEKTVSPDEFALELLRSHEWGSASILDASYSLRNVVLRLAEKL